MVSGSYWVGPINLVVLGRANSDRCICGLICFNCGEGLLQHTPTKPSVHCRRDRILVHLRMIQHTQNVISISIHSDGIQIQQSSYRVTQKQSTSKLMFQKSKVPFLTSVKLIFTHKTKFKTNTCISIKYFRIQNF